MLVFFLPLAASSLLQGLRGPLLDAGMSRGRFPLESLATFALISGVMMMLATSANTLQSLFLVFVRGRASYRRLRLFSGWYAIGFLLLGSILTIPWLSGFVFVDAMGASEDIGDFLTPAVRIMLLFPAAMIARAFFQSILVVKRQTRAVWGSSMIGIAFLVAIAFGVTPFVPLRASTVAALAQVIVPAAEAIVLWLVARRVLADDPFPQDSEEEPPASVGRMLQFVWPLLLTQMAMAGTTPLVSAGILRMNDGELQLAAYRVAWSLGVLGFSAIIMLRQTSLVMAREPEDHRRGRILSLAAGAIVTGVLFLVTLGPSGNFILGSLIGAPPEVAAAALPAWRFLAFLPLLASVRQFYTSLLLHQGKTRLASAAALVRVAAITAFLFYVAPGIAAAGATLGGVARLGGGALETAISGAIGRRFFERAPTATMGQRKA